MPQHMTVSIPIQSSDSHPLHNLHKSSHLNPKEYVWDVVKLGIMVIWTRMSKACFQNLVKSMPSFFESKVGHDPGLTSCILILSGECTCCTRRKIHFRQLFVLNYFLLLRSSNTQFSKIHERHIHQTPHRSPSARRLCSVDKVRGEKEHQC